MNCTRTLGTPRRSVVGIALTVIAVFSFGGQVETSAAVSKPITSLQYGFTSPGEAVSLISPSTLSRITDTGSLGAGEGFFSIRSGLPTTNVVVSVDDGPVHPLAAQGYIYGLIGAGTHRISVFGRLGGPAIMSAEVAVPSGRRTVALLYQTPSGSDMLGTFVEDSDPLPIGLSRVLLHNTSRAGPIDIYENGIKVVSYLSNTPSSPIVANLTLRAGPVHFVVTKAGAPPSSVIGELVGNLLPGDLLEIFVTGDPTTYPSSLTIQASAQPLGIGYRLYASDGGVFDFGDASFYGSTGGQKLNRPIAAASSQSLGLGYWLAGSDGGVFNFGSAAFFGSTGAEHLNEPIVGMASTNDDGGYWLTAADGGIFTFGDATFYGSLGGLHLNAQIVGMTTTADGRGYWLVAADGGVFAFGDAQFYGSMGGEHLNSPIIGIESTVDGGGYWLVASDGGVFTFGDASFYGSEGGEHINEPIVSMVTTPDSLGYTLVASDGGVFTFGDAGFSGSAGGSKLNRPIIYGTSAGAPLPH